MLKYSLHFAVGAMLLAACSTPQKKADSRDILSENVDTTVNPAEDFFKYANGGWIKRNPIPESERSFGIAKLVMNETYDRMKKLSDDAAADTKSAKGSNSQKIGDFFHTAMDSATCDDQGYSKLGPELESIDNIKDIKGVLAVIAHQQMIGCNPLYSMGIYQDEKKSDQYALHLEQGGIGLPNRDYYFNTDARTSNIRTEYIKHIMNTFKLIGEDEATATRHAGAIMKLETDLAKSSRKLEDLRDPYSNYNKMDMRGLQSMNPSLNWPQTFQMMNIKGVDSVIVGQPEFYKAVEHNLKSVSVDDWKTYLKWNLVASFAPYLGKDFDQEQFHFNGVVLSGVKTQRPRWKRVLDNQENYLGDALGQLYVQNYYSPATKERYVELTNSVLAAYKEHIEKLDWMSDSTKQKALAKLATVRKKVGYPDKWRDYSSMNISRSSYVENIIEGNKWYYNYYLNKLGKPVDRDEWDMTPQTYNAYYNPSNNEIVLPAAAFIIPGIPDSLADDALIYGYAGGSTIGHEITHGFDDEGRQFDADGNLKAWWSKEDEEKFNKRAKLYIDQFSNYVVLDSMHVNGKASLGENIADLGGIAIGMDAFKKTDQFKKGEKINGLTPMQRYFMGYALGWLHHQRDEALANQIMTDVHAPAFLRVNGPMANIPEFYEAFGVKEGNKMWRADSVRVKIW
ncbi:MAG: M13 family metallopeptidase [Bacteroidota bacterium]